MICLQVDDRISSMRVRSQDINFRQKGSGEVIILLPPPLLDLRIYCDLQEWLSQHYKTISLNLPHGRNLDEIVSILVETIKFGTINKFHLLASSATGWIAQYLYPYFQNQMKSMILINSFHSNANYGKTYRMAVKSTKMLPSSKFKKEVVKQTEFLRQGLPNRKHLDEYFQQRVEKLDKNGIREQMNWFVSPHNLPESITIPLLLLSPFQDPLIKNTEYLQLKKYHQHVIHKRLEIDSHLLFLGDMEKTVAEIEKFLQTIH